MAVGRRLSRSGIFAGVLLVFIDAVGDPVNASLLGGTHTYVIGQAIQDAYLTNQQYNVAAALSTILMVVLGIMIFMSWPVSSVWAVGTLIGISILFSGITRLSYAFAQKRGTAVAPI